MNITPIYGAGGVTPVAINPYDEVIPTDAYGLYPHSVDSAFKNEAFLQIVLQSFSDLKVDVLAFKRTPSVADSNFLNTLSPLTAEQELGAFIHSLQYILGQGDTQVPITIQTGRDDFINDLLLLINNPDSIPSYLQVSFDKLTHVLSQEYPINFTLEDFLQVMLSNVPHALTGSSDTGSIISTST